MQLKYNKVLLLGATSGIGRALAGKFLETGTSVIAVGRRQDKLDEFAKENSSQAGKVDTANFDITDLKAIPDFAAKLFKKHPDLDCVFLNSGMQRAINWAKPEEVDLEKLDVETLTNYVSRVWGREDSASFVLTSVQTAFMHLIKAFLPHLQKQAPKETSLIFTTSGLALVPILHCPNYCASKAALHHHILAMREQLRAADSNVKVIELFPPAVQTELHDFEMGDKGKDVGMPLKDFIEEAFEGLCKDDNEQIPVQAVKSFMGFYGWEQERQKTFLKMNETLLKQGHYN